MHAPTVPIPGSLPGFSHGLLPLIAVLQIGPFHDAAAGEPEKAGFCFLQYFKQVLAEHAAHSTLRHQRYIAVLNGSGILEHNKSSETAGLLCRQNTLYLCPALSFRNRKLRLSIDCPGILVQNCSPHLSPVGSSSHPKGNMILLSCLKADAVVSFVCKACLSFFYGEHHIVGILLIQRISFYELHCCGRSLRIDLPTILSRIKGVIGSLLLTGHCLAESKLSVLNHLCVEAAVSRIVDILKKHSEHFVGQKSLLFSSDMQFHLRLLLVRVIDMPNAS